MLVSSWACPLLVGAMVSGAAVVGSVQPASIPQTAATSCAGSFHAYVAPGPHGRPNMEWHNTASDVTVKGTTCAKAAGVAKDYAQQTCGGCHPKRLDGYALSYSHRIDTAYRTESQVTAINEFSVIKFHFVAKDCGCIADP